MVSKYTYYKASEAQNFEMLEVNLSSEGKKIPAQCEQQQDAPNHESEAFALEYLAFKNMTAVSNSMRRLLMPIPNMTSISVQLLPRRTGRSGELSVGRAPCPNARDLGPRMGPSKGLSVQ